MMNQAESALQAGRPPDFLFSTQIERGAARWAYDDRLVDLEDTIGPVLGLFDADAIEVSTLLDGKTGQRGLYALPMGRNSNHIHVWNSLLERAGFPLADIPTKWEAFWPVWCDQVQPAVRRATGREDIWAVGLPMSLRCSLTSCVGSMTCAKSRRRSRHEGPVGGLPPCGKPTYDRRSGADK
jgi:multiple sugar transport system substrate-binding protein